MKTKTLLSILMIALCSQLSHSQFLKKFKKRTEQAIEEVIVRKLKLMAKIFLEIMLCLVL